MGLFIMNADKIFGNNWVSLSGNDTCYIMNGLPRDKICP